MENSSKTEKEVRTLCWCCIWIEQWIGWPWSGVEEGDVQVLKRVKELEVEGQRKRAEGQFEQGRCALPIKVDCWS